MSRTAATGGPESVDDPAARVPLVVQVGDDGQCEWVSEAAETLLGWRPDEMLGERIVQFLHPDDIDSFTEATNRLATGPGRPAVTTLRFRRPDGGLAPIAVHGISSGAAADGRSGTIIVFGGEDDPMMEGPVPGLDLPLWLLRSILEQSGDVIVLTRDGVVEWCSPTVEDLSGEPVSQWLGRPLTDRVHPANRAVVQSALNGDAEIPHRLRVRFGAEPPPGHWVDGVIRPLHASEDPLDRHVVSSWRIVDDLVEREAALLAHERDSRQLAEQLQLALESRVVIEQAKGILAGERGVSVEEAFKVLRDHARRRGIRIQDLALAVVTMGLRP